MNTEAGGRILEFSGDGYFLKKKRGFLEVSRENEKQEIPFDEIQSVIFNSRDLTSSNALLVEFARRRIPVIFCDKKCVPVSMLIPFNSYYHQSRRVMMQIQAKKPLNKQLWKEIVISKIRQQAIVLEHIGLQSARLRCLMEEVRSDDSTGCEAIAAKYYFSLLYGAGFKRDRSLDGINAMLNYGYTIYRSAVARAVIASGLNPALGIKHCGATNDMPLVDDLIEPFRPFVDREVFAIAIEEGQASLDSDNRRRLAASLSSLIISDGLNTTPNIQIFKLASSVGKAYGESKATGFFVPEMLFAVQDA